MDILEIAMSIVAGSGDSKSYSMEAIACARENNFEEAYKKIEQAKESLKETHEVQTKLIAQEMEGIKSEVSLMLIHAQDHLMSAIMIKDLALEFITLYEKISK